MRMTRSGSGSVRYAHFCLTVSMQNRIRSLFYIAAQETIGDESQFVYL